MARNYVVVEGQRFDFVKSKSSSVCETCDMNDVCRSENEPCAAFVNIKGFSDMHFRKHVKK